MMKKSFQMTVILLIFILILAACAPSSADNTMKTDNMASDSMNSHDGNMEESMNEPSMENQTDGMEESMDSEDDMMDERTDEMSGEMSAESIMLPDWAYLETTDVSTAEPFTLADYEGKVILVETMAMWCPTCYRQQEQIQALHQKLNNNPDLISISIDVDLHETPEDLAVYIADAGFAWPYTIADQDLARGIANQFGANFLNPPLAPIFVIDRHGGLHQLDYGLKSVDDLEAVIRPILEDM